MEKVYICESIELPNTLMNANMNGSCIGNCSASVESFISTSPLQNKISLMELVPSWCKIVLATYLLVVFVLGIPGNVLVVYIQIQNTAKSVTDWMVLYLAICDVISLCACAPSFFSMSVGWWAQVIPNVVCKLHNIVLLAVFNASNVFITLTALDRLWKTYGKVGLIKSKAANYLCVGTMFICFGTGLPGFFTYKNNVNGYSLINYSTRILSFVMYGFDCIISISMSIVTCVCYIKIAIHLRSMVKVYPLEESSKSCSVFDKNRIKNVKTTKAVFLVALVFVLSSVVPSIFALLVSSINRQYSPARTIVLFFLTRLYFVNNCSNPFFYFYLNLGFRKRALDFLKRV